MSETTVLELEVLAGPLDGANLEIANETEWNSATW